MPSVIATAVASLALVSSLVPVSAVNFESKYPRNPLKRAASSHRIRKAGEHNPKGPVNWPEQFAKRDDTQYVPANATDVKSFVTPTNVTIRYKEPGKSGVCETTPGVNSYSGYVDLDDETHVFFWFFESRRDPKNDPITLWLNGGPGSDSMIGLFEEHGPCRIMEHGDGKYVSVLNPNSWNEVSNMIYLSQPVGVGFSYQTEGVGSLANTTNGGTGTFLNASQAAPGNQPVTGRWPLLLPTEEGEISTTDLAAQAAWHVLQGLFSGLNELAPNVGNPSEKVFNLWTESYGGHYGPGFYNYFYEQNQAIKNGSVPGTCLEFNTLGVINGIVDMQTQAKYYPEFAVNNTYGVKAYNDTVYNYAVFANNMINGCQDQINYCLGAASNIKGGLVNNTVTTTALEQYAIASACSEAQYLCEDNVEGPYFAYGGRGTYDIRHPANDPTTPDVITPYLNQAEVQQAIGVNLNWTSSNSEIYYAFHSHGDNILTNSKVDLEHILARGVRVALMYGDADYICNWFGGQAVSLATNYTHSKEFAAAGYQPFLVDGVTFGETREYGNFSFTRVYESGHEIPYYQPLASLVMFNRTINLVDLPNGVKPVTGDLASSGPANTTKTYPVPTFPAKTQTSELAAYSSSVVAYYNSLFLETVPAAAATKAA